MYFFFIILLIEIDIFKLVEICVLYLCLFFVISISILLSVRDIK